MNTLLEYDNVTQRFGPLVALDGVSFAIAEGGVTALLGPNGAGKSTALRLAVGLDRPSCGDVTTLGVSARHLGPAQLREIAYVADGMELPCWMKVDQFFDWCRPFYPNWDRELENQLRQRFEIPSGVRLKNLSRGQKMMTALVSHLSYRPRLVLLDEPFSGLDPLTRDTFLEGLLELADQESWAMVISSHDIDEVRKLADHLVFLHRGRVTLEANVDELLARYRLVEIRLPDESSFAPGLPCTWSMVEQSGRILRFVDTAFDAAQLTGDISHHLPGANDLQITPMPLRDVVVHHARLMKTSYTNL